MDLWMRAFTGTAVIPMLDHDVHILVHVWVTSYIVTLTMIRPWTFALILGSDLAIIVTFRGVLLTALFIVLTEVAQTALSFLWVEHW